MDRAEEGVLPGLGLLMDARATQSSDRGLAEARPRASRACDGCLCGAVSFEVHGPLRDILLCHCEECRRWLGNVGSFSAARKDDLTFLEDRGLRWISSAKSDRSAERGFCGECGSSLFWRPAESERISIAAGTLDPPTGLSVAGHWYTHQADDWDAPPDDGLPRDSELSTMEVPWR